jgi:hypothetical protein
MNIIVLTNSPEAPWRIQEVRLPTRAANLPLKRDPNCYVGKFEDMSPSDAKALLSVMDTAFADF